MNITCKRNDGFEDQLTAGMQYTVISAGENDFQIKNDRGDVKSYGAVHFKIESELTGAEAVYGFAAWLTCREERTVLSSTDNAAPVCCLVEQFCAENKLAAPRDGWENNLIHPSGECSGPTK